MIRLAILGILYLLGIKKKDSIGKDTTVATQEIDIAVSENISMWDVVKDVRDVLKGYSLTGGKDWDVRFDGYREVDVSISFISKINNRRVTTGKDYIEVYISADRTHKRITYKEKELRGIAEKIATRLNNKYEIVMDIKGG